MIKLKKNYKMSIVLLMFYLSLFLKFLDLPVFSILASFVYSALSISLTFYFILFKFKSYSKIQLFSLCILLFGCITSVFTINYRLQDYILNIQYIGIAMIPLFYKLELNLVKYALYALLTFFLFQIFNGINPNDIFSVSRNSISIFLIISCSYYIIASIQNRKEYDLWPIFLSFFISVWAVGRGGIISMALLVTCLPYCRQQRFSFKVVFIYFIFLLSIWYIYILYADSVLSLAISRMDSMGFDPNGREDVNSEYLKFATSSVLYFVFGVNLPGNPVFEALDLNPHNSFIRLHIYYGLGGFIVIVFLLVKSFFKYAMMKNLTFILLLLVLLIRSSVDSSAFHGPFDGLIYYFIFFVMYNQNNQNSICLTTKSSSLLVAQDHSVMPS